MQTNQWNPLTERTVRAGCQTVKLDASKAEVKARYPWQTKKKAERKDRQNTLQYLRRVGQVSMIQIGPDEFRTPTREERRRAGISIGRSKQNPLVKLAAGYAPGRPRLVNCLTLPERARAAGPYTRKEKLRRKRNAERVWLDVRTETVHGV